RSGGRALAGEIDVHASLTDACRQPLRQVPEPALDDDEPLAKVVGAREEARIRGVRVYEPRLEAAQRGERLAILALARRKDPRVVREVQRRLGDRKVPILERLRLRAAVIVAQHAGEIAALHQHAELEVRHVVEQYARGRDVVAEIAA